MSNFMRPEKWKEYGERNKNKFKTRHKTARLNEQQFR